jgi:hypothetical protein
MKRTTRKLSLSPTTIRSLRPLTGAELQEAAGGDGCNDGYCHKLSVVNCGRLTIGCP